MCLKNGEKGREKRREKDGWKMEDKAGERKWKRKLVNEGKVMAKTEGRGWE